MRIMLMWCSERDGVNGAQNPFVETIQIAATVVIASVVLPMAKSLAKVPPFGRDDSHAGSRSAAARPRRRARPQGVTQRIGAAMLVE
jgi:hypothetical protein